MKNLSTAHYSVRQSLMSQLINNSTAQEDPAYANVMISLLNNAIVFPVPEDFQVDIFTAKLTEYLNTELKADTAVERVGTDVFYLTFSTILLIKKAVVYHMVDSHLYVNVVPVKEMQNANYKEGAISGLLSGAKSDKIFEFVESYIMSLFYARGVDSVRPYGRYYFTASLGLSTILASHLEPGEKILAKLDIHKIEQSKSNALASEGDEAFYLSTTCGSYLMVLDDNLQEKYVETLSDVEMKVTSKLTRDQVSCGYTQWQCTRDNNKLFAEVAPLNNMKPDDKLNGFAQLHFNNADDADDKMQAAEMLRAYAAINNNPFANFEASLIEYSAKLHQPHPEDGENGVAVRLMEDANSLLSEQDFEGKLQVFLSQYQFSSQEVLALIFVISRVKNRIADTKVFASVMTDLKERYYKMDSDSLNRAFVSLSIAKKLNMIGERESAAVFAAESYDNAGNNFASVLSPGLDKLPDDPIAGDAISYAALGELYKSALNESDKLKYAMDMAEVKPLIKSNLDNVLKHSDDATINTRYASAVAVFDAEAFGNYGYMMGSEIDGRFSKLSDSSYMPACTERRRLYSGFKSWAQKSKPDSSISSIKEYGTLVDTNNYHLLYSLGEQLSKYFDIHDVQLYVFSGRNQGVVGNDDGQSKYIYIDSELLDINNPNYMNASELTFILAREYAAMKLGLAGLTCHPQWRKYSSLGVMSLDAISGFASDADFISKVSESYNRVMLYNRLISTPGYFNFDVDDAAKASQMLSDTLSTVEYKGTESISDIREREYAALSLLSAQILDRVGILLSGNIVYAIKAVIHNEQQINGGKLPKDMDVASYATQVAADGKPVNYDFAMRLNSMLSFYISADYKKY